MDLPIELLLLPPLALAAGVDLYLTLLFIGAAPTTGLWETPLPGALGDLDSARVLVMVGAFYLAEFAAERFPATALAWNAFHAVIRPVSGALLTLLLLDGQPLPLMLAGSLLGGILASLAHGLRTGAWVLHALGDPDGPSPVLVSLLEDAGVLGIVALALDAPVWAFGVAVATLVVTSPFAPSRIRAFAYAIRLGIGRIFRPLGLRRWRRDDELPDWVTRALEDHEESLALGEALRGCPAGAWRLAGTPGFTLGWITVRGGGPLFVFRRRGKVRWIPLADGSARSVRDGDLYRRIDLDGPGTEPFLLVGWSGPSTESLKAEFTPG